MMGYSTAPMSAKTLFGTKKLSTNIVDNLGYNNLNHRSSYVIYIAAQIMGMIVRFPMTNTAEVRTPPLVLANNNARDFHLLQLIVWQRVQR